MKVIRRILVILVAMLAAVPAWSETLRWERYNLTFDVPDGGMVTHRTSTAYELQWHQNKVSRSNCSIVASADMRTNQTAV